MYEITREKQFSHKDSRFKGTKNTILFDLEKSPHFTSATISTYKQSGVGGTMQNQSQKSSSKNFGGGLLLPNINQEKKLIQKLDESFLYVGMSNGHIFQINISLLKQTLIQSSNEVIQLKCKETFKHKGAVSYLLWEKIDNTPVLFSGGLDSTIKFWNLNLDGKYDDHYIKTVLGHSGGILSLAYCKSRGVLCSSSSDGSLRVWKLDENFDKLLNPLFHCVNNIKKFGYYTVNQPFRISSLSIKDSEVIELYASDTEGGVHIFTYSDSLEKDMKEYSGLSSKKKTNQFVFSKTIKSHNLNCCKVLPSALDSTIYSIGFDNKLIAYNQKEKKNTLSIYNNKCFYTWFLINSIKQEVILTDEKGFISFVKIFNHSETKVKYSNSRINFIFKTSIRPSTENYVIVSEDSIEVIKVKREVKTVNVQLHEAEILNLFVVDPVKNEKEEILEDTK